MGNVISETDGNGNTTTYQYDALGRQTRKNNPAVNGTSTYETTSYTVNSDGTQVETRHDAGGNKSITVTNKKGLNGFRGDRRGYDGFQQ